MLKRLLKVLGYVAAVLLVGVCVLVVLAVDTKPIISSTASQQVDGADSVNQLLSQLKNLTRRRYSAQNVTLTEQQMNSMVGLVKRAVPEFSGQIKTAKTVLLVKLSYQLPVPAFSTYVNFEAQLLPGEGINLDHVKLGSFSVSGETALNLFSAFINWKTDSDIGTLALEQVLWVQLEADRTLVLIKPLDPFLVRLNQIKKGLAGGDNEQLKQHTTFYLAFLNSLPSSYHKPGLSLSVFLEPVFEKVQQRSLDGDPILENEAAILALAIYAGHHRMANFIGDVQPIPGKVVMPRYRPLLAQRTDLTQHFIISAALKVLSQQGISTAIGEFKELMDRGQGGSGFSFADLAADLAGVQLAIYATHIDSAHAMQSFLANVDTESDFFPQINDLPEGLSKSEFADIYGQVDSEAYLAMVNLIKQRIATLPLYQQIAVSQ